MRPIDRPCRDQIPPSVSLDQSRRFRRAMRSLPRSIHTRRGWPYLPSLDPQNQPCGTRKISGMLRPPARDPRIRQQERQDRRGIHALFTPPPMGLIVILAIRRGKFDLINKCENEFASGAPTLATAPSRVGRNILYGRRKRNTTIFDALESQRPASPGQFQRFRGLGDGRRSPKAIQASRKPLSAMRQEIEQRLSLLDLGHFRRR